MNGFSDEEIEQLLVGFSTPLESMFLIEFDVEGLKLRTINSLTPDGKLMDLTIEDEKRAEAAKDYLTRLGQPVFKRLEEARVYFMGKDSPEARNLAALVRAAVARGVDLEFDGPCQDQAIERVEERLNVDLPSDFKEFLRMYGRGGVDGAWISGVAEIEDETGTVIGDTERAQKEFGLPEKYAVIYKPYDTDETVWCLNASTNDRDYGAVFAIDTHQNCAAAKLYLSFTEYFKEYLRLEIED